MGIVTGYICIVCLFLLLMKFVAKRCGLKQLNFFLMKIHKYVACGFLIVGIIHFILVFPVLDTRNVIVSISGIVVFMAGILLIILCHVLRDRKKEIIFHRSLSLIMLLFVIFHVVFYFNDFNRYKMKVSEISIEEVDLNTVSDGAYIGEYDVGYIYAKVRIEVIDHKIDAIEILEHKNERGSNAETIVQNMTQENRIDVDTISSATNSSLVIKKACENALKD